MYRAESKGFGGAKVKIKYIEKSFRDKSLYLIEKANEIIDGYKADGYELTLRQLYYQFVARDIIPNNQKSYDNLGSLINDARLAGLIDWRAIEDRTRYARNIFHWEDPKYLLRNAAKQFDLNKWKGQKEYVEVWVEKDALVGIVEKAASVYDVPFFSCRGYVSQTEMWNAAQRIIRKINDGEHERATIIHLGDHDPSGKDMTRDINERINMFCSQHGYGYGCFEIQRVALEMEQIYKYNPPPNPAKITDSRCGKYVEQYGNNSWELDALEPSVMENIIISSVLDHLDLRLYRENEKKENEIKEKIERYAENFC